MDRAAAAIESFNNFLPATVAFAGINDVDSAKSTKIDDMESFWFAEVLKYLLSCPLISFLPNRGLLTFLGGRYLTFDDPKHISLDECKSQPRGCVVIT